ncbi:MAG: hypothetical protein ACLQQ4_10035 [Bacteroidia bacterium]
MKKEIIVTTALLVTISFISNAQQKNPGDSAKSQKSVFASLFQGKNTSDTGNGRNEIFKNKKGHEILPRKGDIALGFNAVPVIDFFLNSLNYIGSGKTNSTGSGTVVQYSSTPSTVTNQITGKYFLDSKTAIRVVLGYNTMSGSITNPVQNASAMASALQSGTRDDSIAAAAMKLNDVYSFYTSKVLLSIGYEKRRGYGRLQGFYGVDVMVGCTKNNSDITYGNAFSDQYPTDYTSNFNPSAPVVSTQNPGSSVVSRPLDTLRTSVWAVGIRGFIGVEYFIFPKISIGAEFGWGYSITSQVGVTQVTSETYYNGQNGPADVIQTQDIKTAVTTRGFAVDDNSPALSGASGAITLLFHF